MKELDSHNVLGNETEYLPSVYNWKGFRGSRVMSIESYSSVRKMERHDKHQVMIYI
jgi:hypothetical protein